MDITSHTGDNRNIEKLISDFCTVILTGEDCLHNQDADDYIKSLTSAEKSILNAASIDDRKIVAAIQSNVSDYIQKFQLSNTEESLTVGAPFEFDNSSSYWDFRHYFENTYRSHNENCSVPQVLGYAFDYIGHMSEHYRVFEQFYTIRSQQTTHSILFQVQKIAEQQTARTIQDSIKTATQTASEEASKKAVQATTIRLEMTAKRVEEDAKSATIAATTAAEHAVHQAVKDKIGEVTSKTSEHVITILSIFAGIVLTIVAGLFYSSSVIENVNASNFYRLICISALVGFVCFNLISLMFRFVEKIRTTSNISCCEDNNISSSSTNSCEKNRQKRARTFDVVTIVISAILLTIMVIFFVLQIIFPTQNINNGSDPSKVDVSGNINVSVNDDSVGNVFNQPTSSNVETEVATESLNTHN